jgi:ABC-type nitrate/sulfonate/bicarbonate transport system permease component
VLVRNELINRLSGAGPNDFKIPMVVAVFAVVASLAGSLGGKEILDDVGGTYSPVWVGTVAGIASALLMSMLMITYYMEARRA